MSNKKITEALYEELLNKKNRIQLLEKDVNFIKKNSLKDISLSIKKLQINISELDKAIVKENLIDDNQKKIIKMLTIIIALLIILIISVLTK
jgi:hypothetical protein